MRREPSLGTAGVAPGGLPIFTTNTSDASQVQLPLSACSCARRLQSRAGPGAQPARPEGPWPSHPCSAAARCTTSLCTCGSCDSGPFRAENA